MSEMPSPAPAPQPDWARRTTDFIIEKVDGVATYTATPARVASRAVVYGLVIVVLAPTLLILSVVLGFRLLNVYIPGDIYYIYLGMGLVFFVVGTILMRSAARV